MAERIPHEDKKSFCPNTMFVFHGEFNRLIHFPISLAFPNLGYSFCSTEELPQLLRDQMMIYGVSCPLNAKAQFKCIGCKRLWTSMRARIDFRMTPPGPMGLIALEIFGQDCQNCGSYGEALWYPGKSLKTFEIIFVFLQHFLFFDVFQKKFVVLWPN